MAAILADIGPGDEVIMPSFTFVSTANAFVLRGGVPVFVDVRPDTLNLDESKIEAAITPRTRAIVPVHYAGVGCDMDAIMAIAKRHDLVVIEDAAQGIMSSYRGRPLGSIGHMAALSFHETKDIVGDGCSEYRPGLDRRECAQIAEHPRRDPHARGRQRGAEEQRRLRVVAEQLRHAEPRRHRHRDTDDGHSDRCAPDRPELTEVHLHTDLEQQQDDADLAEHAQRLVAPDEVER